MSVRQCRRNSDLPAVISRSRSGRVKRGVPAADSHAVFNVQSLAFASGDDGRRIRVRRFPP
jgi:hypothetical protein